MFLTGFLIASALATGVKVYLDTKKKKETPWTFVADKRAIPKNQQLEISKAQVESNSNIGDSKTTQLNNQTDIEQINKRVNQNLTASLASLGLAISSVVIFPSLRLLSWLGFLYASASFFEEGYKSIVKKHKINMAVVDTVMFTGIIVTGNLIAGTLMCSLLWLAQKLLLKTEDHSRKSLVNVFGKQPRSVWVLKEGIELKLPFEHLQAGDTIVVNAGEVIAADGTITSGTASIDQHMLTGESQPAEKTLDDAVFAATIVLSGQIHIQVEKAGTESVAAQIAEVLLHTTDFKTITQARWMEFVDKTAPVTLGVGMLALPILGPTSAVSLLYSFNYGYSMRVIAPATMLNFLNLASQSGILIKDGRSLELLNKVDTVVFDKTGTLTLEQPVVGKIHTCNNSSSETLLTYAAAAEYRQTHPIARAILQAADERGLRLPDIDTAQYEVGYGIKVRLAKKTIFVGSPRFMAMSGIAVPAEMDIIQKHCHDSGYSLVMVAADKQLEGAIELHTVIRPEAKLIIRALQQRNISMYIISGDHEKPTKQLAEALGIPHYFAETLPENKANLVEQLQKEGKLVCFIGDGINDSIALKKANVSISMRGATTIATDTAQIVLMDGSLKQLVQLFDVAKNYEHNVRRSFFITLLPTATAIGGILFLHFGLTTSIILYYTGLGAGMSNAILPMLKKIHVKKKE